MEQFNVTKLYQETLSNMQAVLDDRQRMFEIYFFKLEPNKPPKKIQCQSVFCSVDDEDAYYTLSERVDLLAVNIGLDQTEFIVDEMPQERVQEMFAKLSDEVQIIPVYQPLFF